MPIQVTEILARETWLWGKAGSSYCQQGTDPCPDEREKEIESHGLLKSSMGSPPSNLPRSKCHPMPEKSVTRAKHSIAKHAKSNRETSRILHALSLSSRRLGIAVVVVVVVRYRRRCRGPIWLRIWRLSPFAIFASCGLFSAYLCKRPPDNREQGLWLSQPGCTSHYDLI